MAEPYTKYPGVFRLPSGELVTQPNVRIDCGLYEYGPEDVECLLDAGIIEEVTVVKFRDDVIIPMGPLYDSGLKIDLGNLNLDMVTMCFKGR